MFSLSLLFLMVSEFNTSIITDHHNHYIQYINDSIKKANQEYLSISHNFQDSYEFTLETIYFKNNNNNYGEYYENFSKTEQQVEIHNDNYYNEEDKEELEEDNEEVEEDKEEVEEDKEEVEEDNEEVEEDNEEVEEDKVAVEENDDDEVEVEVEVEVIVEVEV